MKRKDFEAFREVQLSLPTMEPFYGEETHINQLEVILDVGYEQDKDQAIETFTEVFRQIFNCLDIMLPDNLICSIADNKEHHYEYNTHKVSLNYEIFERIEQCKLTIMTK